MTSGTAKNVYFVKGTGNELVATVTGTVNVAQSGTGTLKGDNSVAKVVKRVRLPLARPMMARNPL